MDTLFSEVLYRIEKEEATVLVSIIADHGSAPRGTGSLMLVGENGRLWGTIGGGAVEKDAVERSITLLRQQKSELHDYRLHSNTIEDLGMVCGGDVTVWFQYIGVQAIWRETALQALKCMEQNRPAYLCLSLTGEDPSLTAADGAVLTGERPARLPDGSSNPTREDENFFLPLGMVHRAILFGAGHVTRALVPLLQNIGFRPVVFDDRREYTDSADFPGTEVICGDFDRIEEYLQIGAQDFVAVMTSGHKHDYEAERHVLRHGRFAYLGVIGSRAKTASVNERLLADGITQEQLSQVHTPIGTAIKAVTPAEIAISIAGEMIYIRALLREGGAEGKKHHCPM